jgi:hypothetical protein
MKKFFKYLGLVVLLLVIGLVFLFGHNLKGPHPDYNLNLKVLNNPPAQLSAGFFCYANHSGCSGSLGR